MRKDEFETCAIEAFEAIPEEFRRGIDGLVIEEQEHAHPLIADYLTLGECIHGPTALEDSPLFSTIYLYYGSFLQIARKDPTFDVRAEIEETIRHELRHHLEDRAGIPDLADEDWVSEMNERRRNGLPFDPLYYRSGFGLEPGVFDVDGDTFVELALSGREWRRLTGRTMGVRFLGDVIDVTVPAPDDETAFVEVEGGWEDDEGGGGDLFVVLRRR